MQRFPLSPISSLVAHVESTFHGGRVLFIGSGRSRTPGHLLDRGAHSVFVADASVPRGKPTKALQSRVHSGTLEEGSIPKEPFDAVFVENLASHRDPAWVLGLVRAHLQPGGLGIIATASDEATSGMLGSTSGSLGYEDFDALIETHFEAQLLLAQTPFVGYSIVDLASEGPLLPALDNGYLHGAADVVDFFVAIVGTRDTLERLDLPSMSLIQFEASDLLTVPAPRPVPASDPKISAEKLADKDAEIARLLREATEQSRKLQTLEQAKRDLGERLRKATEPSSAELEAQTRASAAEEAAARASAELEHARRRIEKLEADGNRFEQEKQEIFTARKRVESDFLRLQKENLALQAKLKDQEDELYELDEALAEAEDKLKELEQNPARSEEIERELGELHTKVSEKEEIIRGLEEQLARARGEVEKQRELVQTREREADVRGEKLTRVESELVAARARVAEFEKKLAGARNEQNENVSREVEELEGRLGERARHVAELERALDELTTYAKTLGAEVAQWKARAENPDAPTASRELEELGRKLAEREADLVAAEWTIGSLEKKLAGVRAPHSS